MLKIDFGKNLEVRRIALRLERKDLHLRTGVSISNIGYIENGLEKNNPSLDIVERLADGLKSPAWALLLPPATYIAGDSEETLAAMRLFERLSSSGKRKAIAYMEDVLLAEQALKFSEHG